MKNVKTSSNTSDHGRYSKGLKITGIANLKE
jgi:hypothetical protein